MLNQIIDHTRINKLLSEQGCPDPQFEVGMLMHVKKAGIYAGQNKIGVLVHVYHVGIAIYT